MKDKKVTFFILLSISYFLFSAAPVSASEVFFESENFDNQVGSQFQMNVLLNTQKQDINAFEGKLVFPDNLLEFADIKDGNTIVNFWINRPENHAGGITFSGITPGGFSGEKGLLFSVTFKIKNPGNLYFDLQKGKLLKNDGLGTEDAIIVRPFNPLILGTSKDTEFLEIEDVTSPEDFVPHIARSEDMFDGKWFLVFSTQDKDSGIDHYEVKESSLDFLYFLRPWTVSDSPYVVKDQKLWGHVLVKAVDKAGNERIISLNLPNHLFWYQNVVIWIIITVVTGFFTLLICLVLKRRKSWSKPHTQK